jgi:hypothetical protein
MGRRGAAAGAAASRMDSAELSGRVYNDTMAEIPSRVRVVESHVTSYSDTVHFRIGDVLGVGHHNQQWKSYVWCMDQGGHAGWVPDFYIEMTAEHEAIALRDYDATELTVGRGEELDVLDEAGGWLLCRTSNGLEGWIPATCVTAI